MDAFKQNKILIWLVVILVVLNLLSIGGIWLIKTRKYHPHPQAQMTPQPPCSQIQQQPDRLDGLGFELKFNPVQMEKFKELRKKFHEDMKANIENIHQKKEQILNEILSANPDITKLEPVFSEIGAIQSAIEKIVFNQFKDIKLLCDDEQRKHFDRITGDIVDPPRVNTVTPPCDHHPMR